jgi:diguanylate cyclase (GGDEF)-like protein
MKYIKQLRAGISLRVIHAWLIVVTVLMSVVMVYSTIRLSSSFTRVTDATEEHLELEKAALELMDASDYLTEKVQRFTIGGDRRFMDEYFEEAFKSHRREEALDRMNAEPAADTAREKLEKAMDASVKLMDQEYYAMRLVVDAKGYEDYPQQLHDVVLSAEDASLSPEEKMGRATELVLNDEYYKQKDLVRSNMQESLEEIDRLTREVESAELAELQSDLSLVRMIILLLVVTILSMVWLTAHLGINPVLRAVDRIKADSPIPEVGANEFRYLAQEYNKMYEAYKSSIERLNFKASHDVLTGVYNRAGYELLLSSVDLKNTYMLLFDVDNFKNINDTYGHEVGDKALVKLADVLKSNFRSDDHICRIGGDEFVVFMVHTSGMQKELIASKIDQINALLGAADDEVPYFSVSVGVASGADATDAEGLFEQTDEAMYQSKKSGKQTYTFYHEDSNNSIIK